jgi:molecular chaperone GrpE
MMKKEKSHGDKNPAASAAAPESRRAPEQQANAAPSEPEVPIPVEPHISGEELNELKAQAGKAKEHWEQLVRTAADFDNYRKRAARERLDAVKFANESLLQKLVPVLDNLDMAAAAAATAQVDAAQSLQAGVNMILSQLRSVLTEAGLEEIDATGKPFDPAFHEAVTQQETAEVPEGYVVQQLRKGYKLRERLLRPATVVVARKPGSVASE